MNKFLLWGGIVLIIVLGWWWMGLPPFNQQAATSPATKQATTETVPTVETEASIEIKGSKYNPATLTVKAGEEVTVTNMDIVGHSVTADDGSFDTGVLSQNKKGSFMAPDKPGTYKFHCTPHPSIVGTLVVE